MNASDQSGQTPLGLMRLRDPNEALGLAVRLLAGEAPFDEMPLGSSSGLLAAAIDADNYAFVTRGDLAVGVGCWTYTSQKAAEDWAFEGKPLDLNSARDNDHEVAIMLAVKAVDASVVRFMVRNLRDGDLADCNALYFIRDYQGTGRGKRLVRLVRPRVRRRGVPSA